VHPNDLPAEISCDAGTADASGAELLSPLLQMGARPAATIPGVVIAELLALTDDGTVPLVSFAGQPGMAAVRARSSIDLHGQQIGAQLVVMFERGDPTLPIVLGVLRAPTGWPLEGRPAHVEADGERIIISAQNQLVLRCGKASITLTRAGKVLIDGSYVLSRSTGVNRVKGGSVQLN
jgi:hypothetical protein